MADKYYVWDVQKIKYLGEKKKKIKVMKLTEEEAKRKAEILNEIYFLCNLESLISGSDHIYFTDIRQAIDLGKRIIKLFTEYDSIKGNIQEYILPKHAKYMEGDILDNIPDEEGIEQKLKGY